MSDILGLTGETELSEFIIASDMMTPVEELDLLLPDEDLYSALNILSSKNRDVLPVLSEKGNKWLGMLTREDIFKSLLRELQRTQQMVLKEHVGLKALGGESELHQLALGFSPTNKGIVKRLMVPMDAVGKTLRDSDLRNKYGVHVIAIEESDGELLCPPPLDKTLHLGVRLLATVTEKKDDTQIENSGDN